MLWSAAVYLYRKDKLHWIASIPATFITYVSISYIIYEPNMGLGVDITIANTIGVVAALVIFGIFLACGKKPLKGEENAENA